MLTDHLATTHRLHTTALATMRVGPVLLAALLGWAWWAARRERPVAMALTGGGGVQQGVPRGSW